jgi:hypothetical protein
MGSNIKAFQAAVMENFKMIFCKWYWMHSRDQILNMYLQK